jgi:polysaccharide biosynthesis/export protein
MIKIEKLFIIAIIVSLALASCVPVNRIAYVQSDTQLIFHGEPADIGIRPGDEIYVRIGSADEQQLNFAGDAQQRVTDARLLSYTVNEEGQMKLPYIGRINVGGLSLDEASDKIEAALADFLYLPSVFMRFMNTKVTVLGDVGRPGVYMFDYKNINVLQALGYAGDIGIFGNRRNVLIIREDGGKREKHYIDLTRGNLLESEWYNLKSGDIVFVEPLGRKKWGMATVPYNLILSLITTGLFVYTFVQNNINQ